MIKLSVIIPSYKDPLLAKTIRSLLDSSELEKDELEVIAVLDGYWPPVDAIVDDSRVIYLHLGKNVGMREAINSGVRIARGKFIMRTDEHCVFAKGYDREMTGSCKDNWIMTPVRYFLDPVKWKVMDIEPVVYEKLKIRDIGGGVKKFEGQFWRSLGKRNKHRKIDQTMAMQGSCWLMPKSWWEKVIRELDTEHLGKMYQDSHEMVFKTWQAGGKLVVNKNTWFAHKHVSFPRTHQHSKSDWEEGVRYAYETWKDYYEKEVRPRWGI